MSELSDSVKLHMKVERLCVAIEGQNDHIGRLAKTVYGDGNGNRGLVIKTDRLEQSHKNNKKFSIAAITTAIGLVFKSLWDLITNH